MTDVGSRYASEFAYELKDEPPPDTAEWQGLCREERRQPTLDLSAQKSLPTLPPRQRSIPLGSIEKTSSASAARRRMRLATSFRTTRLAAAISIRASAPSTASGTKCNPSSRP